MNSPTRDLLWLAILLIWSHVTEAIATPQPMKTTLFKSLLLDDVMSTEDVLWEKQARYMTECNLMCVGDAQCVMNTFTPGPDGSPGRCRAHSKRQPPTSGREAVYGARTFTPVTTDDWVNTTCTSHGDCTEYMAACYSGKCLCDGGFFFDYYLNGCTSTCTRNLGDTYLEYRGWDLIWHDMFAITGNMSTCTPICNAEPYCITFNIDGRGNCWFKNTNAQSYPTDWRFVGSTMFYQKTCA